MTVGRPNKDITIDPPCPWERLEYRFLSKVREAGPDECWEWIGARLPFGYGNYWSYFDRRYKGAHRYAWERMFGPVPAEKCVLHSCDNPPCVNPAHLFLGTDLDNVQDCIQKGRRARWGGGTPTDRSKS
jgi:hypothetical protein